MSYNTKPVSPLRQRMIEDMALRKLSPKTQSKYLRAVIKFTCQPKRPLTSDNIELESLLPMRISMRAVIAPTLVLTGWHAWDLRIVENSGGNIVSLIKPSRDKGKISFMPDHLNVTRLNP